MVGSCSTTSESSLLESATCIRVSPPIKVNVKVLPEFKVESNVEFLPEFKVNPKPNVEVRVSKTFHKPTTTYIVRPVESSIRRHIYYNDAIRFSINNNRLSEFQLPIDNMEDNSNQLNPTDLIYHGFSRLIRSFRALRSINPRNPEEHHGTWFFSDICGRCLKMISKF
ncbi:hypothetical protein M0804_014671 [Polistes exclamans]|nr:hypothetical protein M0804_014672 [Polistes exclamans]KAI4474787.1 hypothetical protein M0804_014671 [Polistes exclamans]